MRNIVKTLVKLLDIDVPRGRGRVVPARRSKGRDNKSRDREIKGEKKEKRE